MENNNSLKLVLESLNLSNWQTKLEGNKLTITKGPFSTDLFLSYLDLQRIHFVRFEEHINQPNLDPEDTICIRMRNEMPGMTEIIRYLQSEYSLYDRIMAA